MKSAVFALMQTGLAVMVGHGVFAQSPDSAISDAVNRCQSWIDTGAAIDAAEDWTKLAGEDFDTGTGALFISRLYQMQIDTIDRTVIPPGQGAAAAVRLRVCNVQPVRNRVLASDASLLWGMETVALRGQWDGVARLAPSVAAAVLKQMAARYEIDPDYVPWNAPGSDPTAGALFGRCVTDAVEGVRLTFGEGSGIYAPVALVTLNRVDPAPDLPPYIKECLRG